MQRFKFESRVSTNSNKNYYLYLPIVLTRAFNLKKGQRVMVEVTIKDEESREGEK